MTFLAFLAGIFKTFFFAFFLIFLFAVIFTIAIFFFIRHKIRKKMAEVFPQKREKNEIDENVIDL